MPTPLECLVERRARYTLVRLVGPLDLAGTAHVRSVTHKLLVEQPAAIVVDLSGVDACDPYPFALFRALAREAARWPVIPLLLSAPSAAMTRAIGGTPGAGALIHPSIDAAASSVGWGPASPAVAEDLLPVSGAARRAREVVTEACVRWDQPQLIGPACIVVSELVNNAVEHAGTMMTVRLTLRTRYVHVVVQDGSTAPPVLDGPGPRAAARGLRLVAAEATSWGHLATTDGKAVWATLPRES
jgi:hypothetical protein